MDAQQHAAARQVLAAFAAALRDKKLAADDVADCHALGMVLSYFGYWGEDPARSVCRCCAKKYAPCSCATWRFRAWRTTAANNIASASRC